MSGIGEERWQGLTLLRSILGDQVIGYESLGGHELFTEEEEFERVSAYLALAILL